MEPLMDHVVYHLEKARTCPDGSTMWFAISTPDGFDLTVKRRDVQLIYEPTSIIRIIETRTAVSVIDIPNDP